MTLLNRALVFDAQSMRFEDWNGHLRVRNTNLTKANVCEYYGFEIKNYQKFGLDPNKMYRFLRAPDALKQAVGSFKERPILYVHKASDADRLDNSKVIGTTGSDPVFDYPYIQSSITIWDGDYINAIKEKKQAELSASYAFLPVMKSGIFEGQPYDGIMTDIFVDHVALVAEGRAGHDVRVADEGKTMSNLNTLGTKLSSALADRLQGQGGIDHATAIAAIAKIISSLNGIDRKNLAQVLLPMLKDCGMAQDCDEQSLNQVVDSALRSANCAEGAGINTVSQRNSAPLANGLSFVGKGMGQAKDNDYSSFSDCAGAFDAASFAKKIENTIRQKTQQAQEARNLVRPLVGDLAPSEEGGEEILRDVLQQLTGTLPPEGMDYAGLTYMIGHLLRQPKDQSSGQVADSAFISKDAYQRLGAARLRTI